MAESESESEWESESGGGRGHSASGHPERPPLPAGGRQATRLASPGAALVRKGLLGSWPPSAGTCLELQALGSGHSAKSATQLLPETHFCAGGLCALPLPASPPAGSGQRKQEQVFVRAARTAGRASLALCFLGPRPQRSRPARLGLARLDEAQQGGCGRRSLRCPLALRSHWRCCYSRYSHSSPLPIALQPVSQSVSVLASRLLLARSLARRHSIPQSVSSILLRKLQPSARAQPAWRRRSQT